MCHWVKKVVYPVFVKDKTIYCKNSPTWAIKMYRNSSDFLLCEDCFRELVDSGCKYYSYRSIIKPKIETSMKEFRVIPKELDSGKFVVVGFDGVNPWEKVCEFEGPESAEYVCHLLNSEVKRRERCLEHGAGETRDAS